MKQGIVLLKEHLHEGPLYGKNCGLIGVYERITGNLSDSKYYLQKAIEYYTQTDNIQGLFINKLRLAHTYHWEQNFHTANTLLPSFNICCRTFLLIKTSSTNIMEKAN